MGIDETALTAKLADEGFSVVEFKGDGAMWGYTCLRRREVGIWRGLLLRQRVPTLLHEYIHVLLGHDGHQEDATERRINEEVARVLIDTDTYADAEVMYGWNAGAIASELDLPRWVIEAYRRTLERRMAA